MSLQLKVNGWTRAYNRRMLVADARGLFAFVFLDVGNEFRIDDPNGEQCKEVSTLFSLISVSVSRKTSNLNSWKGRGRRGRESDNFSSEN